jgi:hypothetical protein
MTYSKRVHLLTEEDVLNCIRDLEDKKMRARAQMFVSGNVKPPQPTFVDVWNRILAERIAENPNANSYKTMTHRLLKRLVSKNDVSRQGRGYSLTPFGRIRLEKYKVQNSNDRAKGDVVNSYGYSVLSTMKTIDQVNTKGVSREELFTIFEKKLRENGYFSGTFTFVLKDLVRERDDDQKSDESG